MLSFTALSDMLTAPENETEFIRVTRTGTVALGTVFGATWGQLATVVIGLPAHVWLKHNTKQRAWMYVLVGAFAGMVFGALLVVPALFGTTTPLLGKLAWIALASVVSGALAGLTFWLIRRPDRDAPVAPPSSPQHATEPSHKSHETGGRP